MPKKSYVFIQAIVLTQIQNFTVKSVNFIYEWKFIHLIIIIQLTIINEYSHANITKYNNELMSYGFKSGRWTCDQMYTRAASG